MVYYCNGSMSFPNAFEATTFLVGLKTNIFRSVSQEMAIHLSALRKTDFHFLPNRKELDRTENFLFGLKIPRNTQLCIFSYT